MLWATAADEQVRTIKAVAKGIVFIFEMGVEEEGGLKLIKDRFTAGWDNSRSV